MILRLLGAIIDAIIYVCIGGILAFGGLVVIDFVIGAPLWAQLIAAGFFAGFVYFGVKERGGDENETEE